jgi:DNA-3-methyladenine glycosylase II
VTRDMTRVIPRNWGIFRAFCFIFGYASGNDIFSCEDLVMKYTLYPSAPYDFRKMLKRPVKRTSRLTWIDEASASYACSVRCEHKCVPVMITSMGTLMKPRLDILLPDDLLPAEVADCLAVIRRILSTEIDISQFTDLFFTDPFLQPWLPALLGIRPILDADLFQSMIRIMIGQQLNVKFAEELTNRLVMLGDEHVEAGGHELFVFPNPGQIADMVYEDLQALSFSRRKAEYVIDFAKLVAYGDVDLALIRTLDDEKVIEVLSQIRGVGKWTAECLLLFGLGRPDVMPANDVGVQNAVKKVFQLKDRPGEAELRALGRKWSPWRSFATYYFWNTLLIPFNS